MQGRLAKLGSVVGGNGGRHSHRNAVRTIGQKVGEIGRQDNRFAVLIVIGFAEIDRVLVKPFHHQAGDFGHAGFGVTHRGSAVAIDIAEIALAINHGEAGGEILRQANHGVVDGCIPVGMIFTDHIANHAGGLLEAGIGIHLQLAHRIKDAAVNRLQTIPDIRQSALCDGGQGIGEVTLFKRLAQIDALEFTGLYIIVSHGPWL